jgi:hypothetical protein
MSGALARPIAASEHGATSVGMRSASFHFPFEARQRETRHRMGQGAERLLGRRVALSLAPEQLGQAMTRDNGGL